MHLMIRLCGAEVLAVEIADADPAAMLDAEHDVTAGQAELGFGLVPEPWSHTTPDPADRHARRPAP